MYIFMIYIKKIHCIMHVCMYCMYIQLDIYMLHNLMYVRQNATVCDENHLVIWNGRRMSSRDVLKFIVIFENIRINRQAFFLYSSSLSSSGIEYGSVFLREITFSFFSISIMLAMMDLSIVRSGKGKG